MPKFTFVPKISLRDIEKNPWLWDFLQTQSKSGVHLWKPNNDYFYQGNLFRFNHLILARVRTNKRQIKLPQDQCAYEEIDTNNLIGRGCHSQVFPIVYTLSTNKAGVPTIKDKNRVVKYQQKGCYADHEYSMTVQAPHLHVKQPVEGYMVMRRIQGIPLSALRTKGFNRKEKLELTKALVLALKTQLVKNHIEHHDLHQNNIIIQITQPLPTDEKQFEANIIDFGWAKKMEHQNEGAYYQDWKDLIQLLSSFVWRTGALPESLRSIVRLNHYSIASIESVIHLIHRLSILPNDASLPVLDNIFSYLDQLEKSNAGLAKKLQAIMLDAIEQSTSDDLILLRKGIIDCIELLHTENIMDHVFFESILVHDAKQQLTFLSIFKHLNQIALKGNQLIIQGLLTEGNRLTGLAAHLKKLTFKSAYKPALERQNMLKYCVKSVIAEKKSIDIHRNSKYIYAEIGIILASLIVLYPIIAGLHYLVTGQFTFFGQTSTAHHTEKLINNFEFLAKPAV